MPWISSTIQMLSLIAHITGLKFGPSSLQKGWFSWTFVHSDIALRKYPTHFLKISSSTSGSGRIPGNLVSSTLGSRSAHAANSLIAVLISAALL